MPFIDASTYSLPLSAYVYYNFTYSEDLNFPVRLRREFNQAVVIHRCWCTRLSVMNIPSSRTAIQNVKRTGEHHWRISTHQHR
ncbi:hypothetical protein O3M35_007206 [Rhynocoris fuscipes]|uniref:Uncharacterized protein n=1 Tax=Rhynocoris fuscipes TaxID=488301 RepID=A0AAW1DC54_9HEMI